MPNPADLTGKGADKDIKSQINIVKGKNFKIIKNCGNEDLQECVNFTPTCDPSNIPSVHARNKTRENENIEINKIKDEKLALNSYKFSKPPIYVANDYPEAQDTVIDRLKYLTLNVGPKERSRSYNDSIIRLLQLSKPKTQKKNKQMKISINNINTLDILKTVEVNFGKFTVSALVDTGSTHNLISVEKYHKLERVPFTPVKMHMKVAGHVLKENVIGKVNLPIQFKTSINGKVNLITKFYIAPALNGYEAILGANFLMDDKILTAITSKNLLFLSDFHSAVVPLSEN